MTADDERAIRKLDIAWAHKRMEKIRGYGFVAGPSAVTGRMYSADENALAALHKMRTKIGSKKESRDSIDWLKAHGLNGLFEQKLDLN